MSDLARYPGAGRAPVRLNREQLGTERHRVLIEEIVSFYDGDERIRAVGVFGSVGAGTWHELSDVDLDIVVADGAAISPQDEVDALFGRRVAIALASEDSADVVLDSLEELSIRWHTLATTSPTSLPPFMWSRARSRPPR